jgi:hypothetical protein
MAGRDAAFLWETEALRSSPSSSSRETGRHVAPGSSDSATRAGWVTLREASEVTTIPVQTLRSWIKKKRVPSRIEETSAGTRRLVALDKVLARAGHLGRDVDGVIDIREMAGRPETVSEPATSSQSGPPPGTMIVPIEAWDKMLLQLGNLHEAGQQLAEARERAARAETEAAFLRERLAEMRAAQAPPPPTPGPPPPEESRPDNLGTRPSFTAYVWRAALSGLRRKG